MADRINLFDGSWLPIGDWFQNGLNWTVENFRGFFQSIKHPTQILLSSIENSLNGVHPLVILTIAGLLAWQFGGRKVMLSVVGCLTLCGLIGAWSATMTTLSIVLTSVFLCSLIGIPIGVLASRYNRFEMVLRPTLDLMQTIPSFVYLVPVVMLFGIGNVAGVLVTVIYALPPVIRLTNLGIRQVDPSMVEAIRAFGATDMQTLLKVQFPLAVPTIMAGLNQTVMMTLSMTVISSMISVTGLGLMVLRGIGSLDMKEAAIGGFGIVLLAIAVDRFSQSLGKSARERGHGPWYDSGPVGLIRMALNKKTA